MIFNSDIIEIYTGEKNKNFIRGLNCKDIKISVTQKRTGYLIYGESCCCGYVPAEIVELISYEQEK